MNGQTDTRIDGQAGRKKDKRTEGRTDMARPTLVLQNIYTLYVVGHVYLGELQTPSQN